MNNFRDKAALKALSCLFLTLPLRTAGAIPTPWYHNYFHQLNGVNYKQNCSLIDFAQKIRGAALLAYYRTMHKKADLDQALSTIEGQLKEFEKWLLVLEQETLVQIKEKYGMSNQIWHKCLTDIECIKKSYQIGVLRPHPETVHDDAIPTDIKETIIALLQHNGINPQSISLHMVSDPEIIAAKAHNIAEATMRIKITHTESGPTFCPEYIPARIYLFPRVITASATDKISYCAHEIQHLLQQHSITAIIMEEYLSFYCSIAPEELKKSPEHHRLSQIHEAQAEILSAIKNPKIAGAFKSLRQKNYYPNHLYEEHFCYISTIDMLWKVHAKLESLLS